MKAVASTLTDISKEDLIKARAHELGFQACGMAEAGPVNADTATAFKQWIAANHHGDMGYMARNVDKRLDPTLLVPGCRSLIVVAMSYYPARRQPNSTYQLSYYAYGRDYHEVIKERLYQLIDYLRGVSDRQPIANGGSTETIVARAFVDTAPILERYWAQQAGIGWIGKNHQLIVPHAGSYFFLGIIATSVRLMPDTPCPNRCGMCHKCLDACPAGALHQDGMDARRCLSYLTIEQKGPIPSAIAERMNGRIYGCDSCQQACPWNRFAIPTTESSFSPSEELLSLTPDDWRQLTPERYAALFPHSAIARAGYEGLMRNIHSLSAKG